MKIKLSKFRLLKNIILFLFAVVFLTNCWPPKPQGVLSHNEMVDILIDIHLSDAILFVNGYRYDKDSDSVIINKYYDAVFFKHEVTRKEFDSSVDYYSNKHTAEYDKMYDEVIERISKMEEELVDTEKLKNK